MAEAIYLCMTFTSSGLYPELVKQNPRIAFCDFEQAAQGYSVAWLLGRGYAHAKDCFKCGVKMGIESCCYVSA